MKHIEDHQLCVKAGSNEEDLQIAPVNDESKPLFIDSEHFQGYILIRMVNFNGVTSSSHQNHAISPIQNPASPYFKSRNRRYSIMVQGRFKQSWNGNDIVFGGELQQRMAMPLPVGSSFIIKAAKWLDPGIECDAYSEKPYMLSPLLCAMNAMNICGRTTAAPPDTRDANKDVNTHFNGSSSCARSSLFSKLSKTIRTNSSDKLSSISSNAIPSTPAAEATLSNSNSNNNMNNSTSSNNNNNNNGIISNNTASSLPSSSSWSTNLGPFQYGNTSIPEDCTALFKTQECIPSLPTYEKRKKYFLNQQKRAEVEISPHDIYAMDFYDAYIDINHANVKLPGVNLSFWKYWQGIPLNFVARTRDGKVTFFVVQFSMVLKSDGGSSSNSSSKDSERDDAHEPEEMEEEEDDGNETSEVSSAI